MHPSFAGDSVKFNLVTSIEPATGDCVPSRVSGDHCFNHGGVLLVGVKRIWAFDVSPPTVKPMAEGERSPPVGDMPVAVCAVHFG
jgi:hypothetical protein